MQPLQDPDVMEIDEPGASNAAGTKRKVQYVETDEAIYGASRFGHFGEYMRRKRAKLQIQNASMDTGTGGEGKSSIFKGISVYVNGWTKPSVQDIRRLVVQHGGVFHPYLDKKSIVTHVVTCSLTAAKVNEFKHMKVVRPEWLLDSVAAGTLLPWANYMFRPGDRSERSQGSRVGQTVLQPQATPPVMSLSSTPKAEQSNAAGPSAHVVAGPSKLVRELQPSGPEYPHPLYMTDPGNKEDAARVPGYAAHRSNEMAKRVMANPEWRAAHTSVAPDFIEDFYKNSRLHHLSTWKAELKNLVTEAQERAENNVLDTHHDRAGVRMTSENEFSMRGAELVLRSPSRAKGKQKAEDVERVIMHCDFDCFFVSAGLGNQGGTSSTSEIASASYEARAFGIKNGMSLRQARQLCSDVVTIPYEFEQYKSLSLQFYTILMHHADDLEAVSVDEALIDVSSAVARLKSATPFSADDFAVTLAQTIRVQVKQATGCEVSIGVADNIQLARLATRRAKPAGLFHLRKEDVQRVLEPLDIRDLHGFGHSTRQKAKEKLGVTNLGELMTRSRAQLCEALGKGTGETLYKALRGIDDRKLASDKPRKSVSCDINYGIRFENNEQAKEFIYHMAEEVTRRLESISMRGRLLTLKILKRDPSAPKEGPKFMGHGLCESFNKQTALTNAQGQATSNSSDIGDHAWRLLKSWNFDPTELRGIGIHIQKLENSQGGDLGQARLCFQAADKKPLSDGPEPQRIEEEGAPELVVHPASSRSASVERYYDRVDLPSFSQLDMEVVEALPEDIRKELEEEYQHQPCSPVAVERSLAPNHSPPSVQVQKSENNWSKDFEQAKLPFQVTDRKPCSKGPTRQQLDADETPGLVVQPPSSQGEPTAADDAPVEGHANHVSLPSFTQLDMDVMEALPEDIRKELEEEYRRRSRSPMVVERLTTPSVALPSAKVTAKSVNMKRITQQLAPRSGSSMKSTLFVKRDTPASVSAVRISDAELRELDIDPDVFAALPVAMQREQLIMARHTKKAGTSDDPMSERRLLIKDSTRAAREKLKPACPQRPPPKACYPKPPTLKQQGKHKGEKVSFTETEDVQQVIESWVERFEGHTPNQKDVDFFSKFLVQSVEFSDVGMEKTIAVMRWWLILLRRRWGVYERDVSEVQQATSEIVGKAWWKAFCEVKDRVNAAARKRFGGTLVLT